MSCAIDFVQNGPEKTATTKQPKQKNVEKYFDKALKRKVSQ